MGHILHAIAALMLFTACDYNKPIDYDAKADFKKYQAAEQAAIDAAKNSGVKEDPAVAMMKNAKKKYNLYCASCHGADGAANSP